MGSEMCIRDRRDDTPRSLIVGHDVDSIRDLFEHRKFEAVDGKNIIVCAIRESGQTGNPCVGT